MIPKLKRLLRWLALALAAFTVAMVVILAIVLLPMWASIRAEIGDLADKHVRHEVSHPGWSFPATVWSAPASLDLPRERLVQEAKARDYEAKCPPVAPGQFCAKTGEIIPRGGLFPEGVQPPGLDGWTRPLALEPVRIGMLLGPDAEIRWHLPVNEAPKVLIDAILAAEDTEFYEHHGVNLRAGVRAVVTNMQKGGYSQGASTLTMQMVRMLNQQREKTIQRKLREAAAAFALDGHLGKEGVLQLYLDAPYMGQMGNLSVCGFRAASLYYYGVEPSGLTLSQAATLAGILPAPGRYAPDRNPARAKERRDFVLGRMRQLGYEVDAALAEPIDATPHPLPPDLYPAYLQATRVWLEENLTPAVTYGAGLTVWTALDVGLQEVSDKLLADKTKYLEGLIGRRKEPLRSAAVLIDARSGALVTVYGGEIGSATDFNRATQARRQPGSSFKPLVYALAFNTPGTDGRPKYTASYAVPNSPREFKGTGGWRPRNVSGEYSSSAALAYGMAWSQNIATASLLEELGGPAPLIQFAQRLGFDTSRFKAEMGLALGQAEVTPLEMGRFAATIINGGRRVDGSPVLLATDAAGAARFQHAGPGEQVMTPEAAALTRELMRLVIEVGTGGGARGAGGFPGYSGPSVGKTGTTDKEKDLWFNGGTPHYAATVWLGFDQPASTGATASDLAAPLWGWWMHDVHAGLPKDEFAGLELPRRGICTVSGLVPGLGGCRVIAAPFLPGTAPKQGCSLEHPPPPPEEELDPEAEGDAKPKWESLWKRKAREAEEAAAASGTAPGGAPAPPQAP